MGGFSQNIQNLKGPTRVIKILGNHIAKSVVIFLDLCVTIPLKHGSASGITKRLETIIFLLTAKKKGILKYQNVKKTGQPCRIFLKSWKADSALINSLTKFAEYSLYCKRRVARGSQILMIFT